MKSDEEDELGAEEEATFDYADGACRDAEPRGKCYKAVDWAMTQGIWEHPEWYEGLKPTSPFKDFQAKLHETKNGNCPKPCTGTKTRRRPGPKTRRLPPRRPRRRRGRRAPWRRRREQTKAARRATRAPRTGRRARRRRRARRSRGRRPAARASGRGRAARRRRRAGPRRGRRPSTPRRRRRRTPRSQGTARRPPRRPCGRSCGWRRWRTRARIAAGPATTAARPGAAERKRAAGTSRPAIPWCATKRTTLTPRAWGTECPEGWDCAELGASPRVLELPPAGELGELHGDLLFCFSVVTRASGRSALPEPRGEGAEGGGDVALSAFQKKETRGGGFGCDGHTVIHGMQHEVGSSSYKPLVDAFIDHWKAIEEKGHYRKYDWVVKVDPDAVFFPDRLRSHLHQLKVPAGARVYVENSEFRYRPAAPGVLSGEAAELLFSHIDECAEHLGHQAGQDYFLKACLDAIGANHQDGISTFRFPRYMDPYAKDPCSDSKAAAFHPYKKVAAWQKCWQRATEAGAKEAGDAAA
ncbi:unnamed protein product [Prorocentrum cordatum]|uniref:Hexosyltransferase n=1 Tax=Prorocentrum cordatum TaxID=2364126 RepID=A0ABN9SYQ8_9DINO|nr:unnamed protein product [Polarella glacialis]